MSDDLLEMMNRSFDRLTALVWEMFERDLEMTENILRRTETLFTTVEAKIPSSLRRFFNPSSDQ